MHLAVNKTSAEGTHTHVLPETSVANLNGNFSAQCFAHISFDIRWCCVMEFNNVHKYRVQWWL